MQLTSTQENTAYEVGHAIMEKAMKDNDTALLFGSNEGAIDQTTLAMEIAEVTGFWTCDTDDGYADPCEQVYSIADDLAEEFNERLGS